MVLVRENSIAVRAAFALVSASSLGQATALVGLLRAIPFHARQRRVYLPTAVVEAVAVEMGDLFELRPHAGLARAVEQIAGVASGHLDAARRIGRTLPRSAAPVMLQAVLAGRRLDALRAGWFDVFAPPVQNTHPLRVLGLLWRAAIGRY